MAVYSLDLRKRVLRAWDSGMDVYSVATNNEVSRAWVHRLVQRRRETGSIEARKQTKFRHLGTVAAAGRAIGRADHGPAGCHVGGIAGGGAHHGGAEHAVADDWPLGIHRQKKLYTPTNSVALTSPRPAATGKRRSRSAMPGISSFSTNPA